jgi:hypothetical protein
VVNTILKGLKKVFQPASICHMKKLILLGLIAIGVGAGASAQAGGFAVVNPFPVRFFPPPLPIFCPPPVVFAAGCGNPVFVHGGYGRPDYRPYRYGVYGRHDGFDRHGGFDHRDGGRRDSHDGHGRR